MLLSMLSIDQLLRPTWERLARMYPELPADVEILIGNFQGECGPARETGGRRVYIGNDRILSGSTEVLQQMLHCGAHILAVVRGINDTSQGFRYHNADFLAIGQELGLTYLEPERNPIVGWSHLTLTSQVVDERYADIANRLALLLPDVQGQVVLPRGRESSRQVAAVCRCHPPLSIRAARSTLALSVIRCDRCGALFVVKDDE